LPSVSHPSASPHSYLLLNPGGWLLVKTFLELVPADEIRCKECYGPLLDALTCLGGKRIDGLMAY